MFDSDKAELQKKDGNMEISKSTMLDEMCRK